MTKCLGCGVDNPASNAFCEKCGKPLAGATGPALETLSALQTIGGEQTRRRAQPQSEAATLEPGAVFADRYTIESLIGIGGMGEVYRAKDRIGDRTVALKLIRSDRLGGESAVNRLISEGVLTQDIRHKNIVSVYHVDQVDGRPFIAMEFVNGVSLREWHRKQVNSRTDVPVKVAARIIAEIINGLQVAHEMGVIHRDLKPENIMLTSEPTEEAAPLKLLDFGIARSDGKAAESGSGTSVGTPRYMAPEQITNPESAGAAADIYSLSTIFYELLVDVLPQGGWQPPSSGRPDVPAGIDGLIQSGLQNRPASRPQSVAEYREKLNAAIGRLPRLNDRGGDISDNNGRAKQRNWLKIGGGAFAGILLLAGIASLVPDVDVDEGGGGDDGRYFPPPPPPPPPPPVSNYARLNGRWIDDTGGMLNVSVNPGGGFSGGGQTGEGVQVRIEGSFSEPGAANYTISNGAVALPGQLSWNGQDCHLDFRTMMPDGSVNMQGKFHVNHPPGAPCPAP